VFLDKAIDWHPVDVIQGIVGSASQAARSAPTSRRIAVSWPTI
jgi:hypothetical protein